jgi:hypothetical protein
MVDRWYFIRAGVTFGPVAGSDILALAGAGNLKSDDYVWPEGCGAQITVQTFSEMSQAGNLPDWLADVQEAERLRLTAAQPPITARAPAPDWLDDVRQIEGRAKQ